MTSPPLNRGGGEDAFPGVLSALAAREPLERLPGVLLPGGGSHRYGASARTRRPSSSTLMYGAFALPMIDEYSWFSMRMVNTGPDQLAGRGHPDQHDRATGPGELDRVHERVGRLRGDVDHDIGERARGVDEDRGALVLGEIDDHEAATAEIAGLGVGLAAATKYTGGVALLVDRETGRVSQLNLPNFDAFYSLASWYRDYAAYCGVSDDGAKVFAIVAQLGSRKPILKRELGPVTDAEMPDGLALRDRELGAVR